MAAPQSGSAQPDPIEPDEETIALRAYHLSYLPNAGADRENWERARHQLREERNLIADRAAHALVGTPRWLRAERQLTEEGIIPLSD